ncbi:hypothetical protein EYF80_018832 [Liparis tanakae]|uniref:Uncharacterized protein n=1 Tax=Liparis tanakae TaxID=230148 RepID=A0A4Z2HYZ8_9TELE|nr:hypothetical protein EYF80_018832 [Liparis tanakae]
MPLRHWRISPSHNSHHFHYSHHHCLAGPNQKGLQRESSPSLAPWESQQPWSLHHPIQCCLLCPHSAGMIRHCEQAKSRAVKLP